MNEHLNEKDDIILDSMVTKITALEKRTGNLEENQKPVLIQNASIEIEGHLMLIRELLTYQKEHAGNLIAMSEEQNTIKAELTSLAEQVKSLQSNREIDYLSTNSQLREIKKIILNSPREVLHEKRYLLFPEHNPREYYGVLKWGLYTVITCLSYFLAKYIVSCYFHLT